MSTHPALWRIASCAGLHSLKQSTRITYVCGSMSRSSLSFVRTSPSMLLQRIISEEGIEGPSNLFLARAYNVLHA